MIRYEIYCGLAVGGDNRPEIEANSKQLALQYADELLGDYTYFDGHGRWKGDPEGTLLIVYMSNNSQAHLAVVNLCERYKRENNQDAVFYTKENLESRLV